MNCRQLAKIFRILANEAVYPSEACCHEARAGILDAFGDQEVPEAFWDDWDCPRFEKLVHRIQAETKNEVSP